MIFVHESPSLKSRGGNGGLLKRQSYDSFYMAKVKWNCDVSQTNGPLTQFEYIQFELKSINLKVISFNLIFEMLYKGYIIFVFLKTNYAKMKNSENWNTYSPSKMDFVHTKFDWKILGAFLEWGARRSIFILQPKNIMEYSDCQQKSLSTNLI